MSADKSVAFSLPAYPESFVASASLIGEAFNVYHETGLTPRQLAEQRGELLKAAKRMIAAGDATMDGIGDDTLKMIEFGAADFDMRAIIAKCEAK